MKIESGIIERDGELIEVTAGATQKKKKSRDYTLGEKAQFFAGLKTVGIERGYKDGWASNQYREKFSVWPSWEIRDIQPGAPTMEVRMWVKSQQIRYAMRKKKMEHQHARSP